MQNTLNKLINKKTNLLKNINYFKLNIFFIYIATLIKLNIKLF